LKKALGAECFAEEPMSPAILSFQQALRRRRIAKAGVPEARGVVLQYRSPAPEAVAPRRAVATRRRSAGAAVAAAR
jgi:hypothetical protein